MPQEWSAWSSEASFQRGIDAVPSGPGVLELRNSSTHEALSFTACEDTSAAAGRLMPRSFWRKLLLPASLRYALDAGEVEYRVCPTATVQDARAIVESVQRRRRVVLTRFAVNSSG
jgi:hypothetical protein